MKKLCQICNREFDLKTKIITEERYGVPKKEIEVEEEICPNCQEDDNEGEELSEVVE